MKQSKILLDTCSYFRLARCLHPLLGDPFGVENYCLYIIEDLIIEYENQQRLHNKYGEWFNKPEYKDNRKKKIKLSPQEQIEYERAFDIILKSYPDKLYYVSLPDIKILSFAYVLKIPFVTDDENLILLAKEFKVKIRNSLDLLKLMLDCKRISLEDIRNTVKYWLYIRDLPKGFKKDYEKLFEENPPSDYVNGF